MEEGSSKAKAKGMKASEAARVVLGRIQALEPIHACRIMGHILNQNNTDLVRLAQGPDSLLRSLITTSIHQMNLISTAHASNSTSKTKRTSTSSTTNKKHKKLLTAPPPPQHMPTQSSSQVQVVKDADEEEDSFTDDEDYWSTTLEGTNEQSLIMDQIAQIESDEMFARCLHQQINAQHDDTHRNTTSTPTSSVTVSQPNQMNPSLYLNGQYFTLHQSPLPNHPNPTTTSIETRFSGAEMEYEMWLLSEVRKGLSSSQMDPARKAELLKELETMYENRSDEDLPNSSYADFYGDMFDDGDDVDEPLGATDTQINNLPLSTVVQGDKVEEEEKCAICLEAPSVGSLLRHLPCMHKLHKECIDRWLRIKHCCPICKMSIS